MYLIHRACRLSRVGALLSLSSAGRLSCLVVHPPRCCCWVDLVVHHRHRHCCPQAICPVGASLSVPHVVVVIHGPFDLQRPCHHRCPVGCLVVRSPHHCHQPSPTSSSLSSSTGHLTCRGLVIVVVRWGALSSIPHIIVISRPPHHRHHRHHPWAICPAEALSSSLSGGGLVLVLVVCGLFVLQRPCCRCCLMGASSSSSSSAVLFSCGGLVPVIVIVSPRHIVVVW